MPDVPAQPLIPSSSENQTSHLDDLIHYKNFVFGEYERAKNEHSPKVGSLAFQTASLEESIAEEQIKVGRPEDAVIHLVSQGSLLMEIGHFVDARSAWERAKALTSKEKVKNWIDEELRKADPE